MADTQTESPSLLGETMFEGNELSRTIELQFKTRTPTAKQTVERAVQALARSALANEITISDDATKMVSELIQAIDKKLEKQINHILHHPEFQRLEGAWRGLEYLVRNTETDEMLKIRFLNISKSELTDMLKRKRGTAWDQSVLFQRVYEEEYGALGGEPYGCMVADYYFDHMPEDVYLLKDLAQIGAAAHMPIITGAAPTLLNMDSWQELPKRQDLTKIFGNADYAPWRSLRDSTDAIYLGLAMPRFLARLPYGAKTNPVADFAFEEDVAGKDHNKYVWANAAYAMARNINRAFKEYGWCTRIRGVQSGGEVEDLPVHTFPTDDGGVDMKCPTEIAITDRREAELAKAGLIPLVHRKNSDRAVFLGAQSLNKPAEYDNKDATASANLSARLPYLFATCRFAHYLKCIVRDKIGDFKERDDMQRWLQTWITRYVDGDPKHSPPSVKARKPLAEAQVVVEEVEGNPGYYRSEFYLRPHYQLEGLSVKLSLVSTLPAVGNS